MIILNAPGIEKSDGTQLVQRGREFAPEEADALNARAAALERMMDGYQELPYDPRLQADPFGPCCNVDRELRTHITRALRVKGPGQRGLRPFAGDHRSEWHIRAQRRDEWTLSLGDREQYAGANVTAVVHDNVTLTGGTQAILAPTLPVIPVTTLRRGRRTVHIASRRSTPRTKSRASPPIMRIVSRQASLPLLPMNGYKRTCVLDERLLLKENEVL